MSLSWKQGVIVELLLPPVVVVVPAVEVTVLKIFPKEAPVSKDGLQTFLSNIKIRITGVQIDPKLIFPLLSRSPSLMRN